MKFITRMAVKVCCIQNCKSHSTRSEDIGVTFHKFPREVSLCDSWVKVTRHDVTKTDTPAYVCSRHFCKSDFQCYKDSKYVLKSDAIPSIFPWITKTDSGDVKMEATEESKESLKKSTEGDGENLDAIKKFIEDQEKEYIEQEVKKDSHEAVEPEKLTVTDGCKDFDERLAVASSMMDMILNESEERIAKRKDGNSSKQMGSKGGNSMSLSVGSKVEARDFAEDWYPAQISEVDYDEMEVLVHYENSTKKHDEWISVSSPRLRPLSASGASSPKPALPTPTTPVVVSTSTAEEPKPQEEKTKLTFVVGERCLARWRDSRRFVATITKDFGNGHYEVVFDDGFVWKCKTSRLNKMKDQTKSVATSVDTSAATGSVQSPVHQMVGPHTALPLTPIPAFHTHLFDPTRDYLGSKSERREMKRKLNIKEIFNIGQKKAKKTATPKEKPVMPKEKPVMPKEKPVMPKEKPETPKEKPVTHKEKPVTPKEKPVTPKEKPVTPKEKPATPKEKPVTLKEKSMMPKTPVEKKKPRIIRKKPTPAKVIPKKEIPDAVASIIGTLEDSQPTTAATKVDGDVKEEIKEEIQAETEVTSIIDTKEMTKRKMEELQHELAEVVQDVDEFKDAIEVVDPTEDACDTSDTADSRPDSDPAQDCDMKLEKFDEVDDKQEVIDRIKEVITKLEDGISKAESSPKTEVKDESVEMKFEPVVKKVKKLKIKKKKLRVLHDKKAKSKVEQVQSELEVMKRKFEAMRRQMMNKTEELTTQELPESFLLPGEWCCKWVNGQPLGKVCELALDGKEKTAGLPRRSVQVEDKRLPDGWTKHMVRRSLGNSAGKWDVVLVNQENRRFHTKTDMRNYLESQPEVAAKLKDFEPVLMDFGVHLKLARRMGWVTSTPDGVADSPVVSLPAGTLSSTSPIVKRKKLSLKRPRDEPKAKKKRLIKMPKYLVKAPIKHDENSGRTAAAEIDSLTLLGESSFEAPPLEDGYVWVGSLKVQIIENLLRCPAEGCFKNFRNNTLLQMHIKHYHREMRKMLGRTPKVLDLASARSNMPVVEQPKTREPDFKTIKVKIPKPPKRVIQEEPKPVVTKDKTPDLNIDVAPNSPVKSEESIPKMQDSPKLRHALANKPVKRPKVLLPVRRLEPEEIEEELQESEPAPLLVQVQDFETAISTHTVTKPFGYKNKEKKGKVATLKPMSEDDEWLGMASDVETRSSFPRSGTPDMFMEQKQQPVSSESNEEQKDSNMYMYTETGERIKIVHMKREEIINCHCGFREEDGLMVQCELCLCWQHALCHNIQKESEVPEKYTCSICLNPRRGRRSRRFLHDQDRLYEGLLPGARPCESLRRSHELSGNLLRVQDTLHALRVKYYVATKKNHPKLYLWAKDWENGELSLTQEKLNSDYSDLNVMISSIGKENLPIKPDDLKDAHMDIQTPPSEDHDRYSQREGQLGSQSLLSGLLSSPGGASLDLPISASELERLASTVHEEVQRVIAPQPEAAIENGACRERLLRHIQRCQAVIDARLDSIEAQVAELESQDPSFEDDETADYFPRTKQTIQMLMRDLDTMEELGVIT